MPALGTTDTNPDLSRALALLRTDPLRHIVTLKMIHVGGAAIQCRVLEEKDGWGLLSQFSPCLFEYDQQTYPDRDWVVLIDGNSETAKSKLLDELPGGPLVVKTYDPAVKEFLSRQYHSTPVRSFVSFTSFPGGPRRPPARDIIESISLEPAVAAMFAANGYLDTELARHFADGARWFGIQRSGRIVSACFVFRNFETVWEIGGVFTEPDRRRQGLASQVVAAALDYLNHSHCLPRYQVRSDNLASIDLAKAAGLVEFLRMDHYFVDRKS